MSSSAPVASRYRIPIIDTVDENGRPIRRVMFEALGNLVLKPGQQFFIPPVRNSAEYVYLYTFYSFADIQPWLWSELKESQHADARGESTD